MTHRNYRRKGNRPDPVMQAAAHERKEATEAARLADLEADWPRDVHGQLLMFVDDVWRSQPSPLIKLPDTPAAVGKKG